MPSSCVRRASIASCTRSFAALMRAPAAGRSLAGSAPKDFSASVRPPFLPNQRTRQSSSAASELHAATSRSACSATAARSLTCRSGRDAECRLSLLCDRAEAVRIVPGEVRQHVAVDLDTGPVQAVDHAAVVEPIDAGRRIDARDPQGAKLPLLGAAVAIRVLTGLDHRLFGGAIDLASGVVIALRLFQNFIVTGSRRHTALDSCHGILRLMVREQRRQTADVALIHEAAAT